MFPIKYNHNRNNFMRNNAQTSVKFRNNEKDIVLEKPKSVLTPGNCSRYDRSLVHSKDFWHQIVITKNNCNKTEIERALIDAVNDEFFIPIAYKIGVTDDTFYIYNQGHALEELLKENLTIKAGEDKLLNATLNLGIARYQLGQIDTMRKIEDALESRLKKMTNYRIDLSNFKLCEEFFDIKLWIGIEGNFSVVCDKLVQIFSKDYFRVAKQQIAQIDLEKNGLKSLKPMLLLKVFDRVDSVNLKGNSIDDYNQLRYLNNFKLKHLTLGGNPVEVDRENLETILTSTFPELIHCDIPRVFRPQTLQEHPAKRQKLDDDENIPISDGGNIVTPSDINPEFKDFFHNSAKAIESSWTKVFIEHGGNFEKQEILDAMFEQFFDHVTCYPCYYENGEKEDSFFLFKNFQALEILINHDLTMKINDTTLNLRLHLRCADHQEGQIKFYRLLPEVIASKVIAQTLNLKDLQTCPKLKHLTVNMSSQKNFKNVMDWVCALTSKELIIDIDLSGNGIKHVEHLGHLVMFPNLKVLNLSNNLINTIIGFPKDLKIVVLKLDQNPLCAKYYHQPYRYVAHFTQLCKNLEYLDGHRIDKHLKTVTFKNFHCTSEAFNAVENFVNYFFKHFDNERHMLKRIYTPKSLFTERKIGGPISARQFQGQSSILEYIMKLPPTQHDLINTSIDVPLFNHKQIQIIVSGIIKIDRNLYTYTRNFLLVNNEHRAIGTLSNTFIFTIANEIVLFSDIKDPITRSRAFKVKPACAEDFKKAYEGKFTEEQELEAKIVLFQQITMLRREKCKRFLEDACGSITDAIQYFSNFYQKNILKPTDFEEPKTVD